MAMAAKKKTTFEDNIQKLEELVTQMEEGGMPLEQSLALYEKGIALARACTGWLDETEQKLKVLTEDELGGVTLKDALPGEDGNE